MHTITARLNHPQAGSLYQDCYCYDEPSIDLIAEPLVHQTTTAIQALLGDKPEFITIHFTDDICEDPPKAPGSIELWLTLGECDPEGTTYAAEEFDITIGLLGTYEVWLCNHLFDYFDKPPETLHVTVMPHP